MPGQATVTMRDKQWQVGIASTPWELVQGLGGLSEMAQGTGMLFDMGFEQTVTVTTEPMLFPLDIAFFSESLVITEVYRNVQPGYLVTSTSPARYFLEVNAGEMDGVDIGSQASVDSLPLQQVPSAPDWIAPMSSFVGFILMGGLAISLVKDLAEEALEEPAELRLVEAGQSESGLLNPWRFPKRTGALNKLGVYDVVHVHDDGDLTVRSHDELYVVTTDGKVFEQELNTHDSLNETAGVCEGVSPQYYNLLRWVGVPLPDYSFAIEPETKERKIDEVLKRLKEGVDGIQQSDNFRTFLLTMAKFHDYSIGNLILIMLQRPNATRVAGFTTWKHLGRWVKKGENGIAILAPCMPPKGTKAAPPEEREAEEGDAKEELERGSIRPLYFKVVHVFDLSQTEGKPLPQFEVPSLTGEANETLFARIMRLSKAQGLEVSFEPRPEQDPDIKGMYFGKSIWVKSDESRAQQLKTLIHEVAHYYSENVFRIPRADAETIAESVAFTVGAHHGFDTGTRSFPYVALWSKDKKVLEANLAAIRKVSAKIIDALEQTTNEMAGMA